MFGAPALRVGTATFGPRDLGGVKPKQLLELLLLDRGRTLPKDRAADALWGERLPRNVAATIESYVSVLRHRLGRALIVTETGGYRIPAEAVETDVDRFDALLREGAATVGEPRRAALAQATALAAEDLLADEPYATWVIPTREHYRERRRQALLELAECCLELDRPADALDAALGLDPASERAARAAMRAHRALGDRDAALRAYDRLRTALHDQLGVAPGPETAELHLELLREDEAPLGRLRAAQPIAYTDGPARIAYQVVGDGAIDIVFAPSHVTNLGTTWDDPTYAGFLRRLGTLGRLILFDKRGTGLSDPALDFPTTKERSDDLVGVLDAAGSERALLLGVCGGGALCVQFAADHPERTAALVLHNSAACFIRTPDHPWGWSREDHERLLASFEEAWLNGPAVERRNPGLTGNAGYRDWFGRYIRLAANPWMARRLAEMNAEIDVREQLPAVRAPTLVICRTDDVWLDPENSRYLAARIPGARLVELPGVDHDPWVGDTEPVLEALAEHVRGFSKVAA